MTLFHKCAIALTLCFLSAFQIDSYHADKLNINGLYWIIAIVTGLLGSYYAWKGFANNKPEE